MNKKQTIFTGLAGFGLIGALIPFASSNNEKIPNTITNADSSYVLNFVPFEDGAEYGSVYTQSGYEIVIHCTNYHTSDGHWGYLSGGASIYNQTLIAGIKSMTLTFYDNTSSGTMNWRWDSNNFYDSDLEYAMEEFDSSESLTKTFYFEDDRPSYFWFKCDENEHISIESISLTYSCIETTKPAKYRFYSVAFYNSTFNYETYQEEATSLITTYYRVYGSLINNYPSSYGDSWCYNGEEVDFSTFRVRNDITLVRHQRYNLKYVQYSLNEDGETYTATLTTNYNDNNYWCNNLVPIGNDVDKDLVTKVIVSTGIKKVNQISSFSNLREVVFSSEVTSLSRLVVYSCSNYIESITFEGNLPEMTDQSIRLNSSGRTPEGKIAKVFVNEDVYDSLEHKYLYGYRVYKIGDTVPAPITMSLQEYKAKSNAQAVAIADHLLSSCKTDLDREALLTPLSIRNWSSSYKDWSTIKSFALDLTSGCSTDTEKAHAIYYWIQTNIDYDSGSGYLSPIKAFTQKKGVCAQYAFLMIEMLSAVNIQSFYIHGYKSMPSISVSDAVNEIGCGNSHAWVIADIDDSWYFYDPTSSNLSYNSALEKMSLQTINSYGYSSTTINFCISCLPEEIELEYLNNLIVRYHQEKLRYSLADSDGTGSVNSNGLMLSSDATAYGYNWDSRHWKLYNPSDNEFEYGEVMYGCVDALPVWGPNPENQYSSIIVDYEIPSYLIGGTKIKFSGSFMAYLIEELGRSSLESLFSYYDLFVDENMNVFMGTNDQYHFIGSGSTSSTLYIPSVVNERIVKDIYTNAFKFDINFESVYVSENISKVCLEAFAESTIQNIYLPSTITEIEAWAFSYAEADVYLKGSLSSITLNTGWDYNTQNCTFHENYSW